MGVKILGIIPARGGSKGVPGKNIKPLSGKPLLHYTAAAALAAKGLTHVLLSSDDEAIIGAGRSMGLEVPFVRPAELSQDSTPTLPVVEHALAFFAQQNVYFDAVCLLQTTSPFRPKGFVDEAIDKFISDDADSLISVVPVPHEFNPHWVFVPGTDGMLRLATGEKDIIARRQLLPPAYIRDGSIYLVKTDVINQKQSFYGDKIAWICSNPEFYVNIDTPKDWVLAEEKLMNWKKHAAIHFD
ncbi:MAG: acylneuraminate cytidylyltransferase family protein [Bacteroidetes bacterium]|nr:MAG: acylneuraminate cytidylyltransferase family protein [Bacteroidota bacterium]